ncbi:ImmA/IrrE family metallo-endopeptidase [Fischerella sp. PCC 9605]|uniref:ImmA/IrrE family metallo-endopeptidase n=1 Tax=Fischerella sp. PCC 9605 TaxID=1173024 RepID=UPI00047D6ABA|nr:hypothetical protein [Fischerella sp. PCC 9605]
MRISLFRNRIVILLGLFLVLGVIPFIAVRISESSLSKEERVAKVLNSYINRRLTVDDLLAFDLEGIYFTEQTYQYIAGSSPEEFIEQLREQDSPEESKILTPLEYLNVIAQELVKGSDFEGKVQINKPPQPGFINIYLLNKDPNKLSRSFSNCSYIGYMNTIICNANFLKHEINLIRKIDKLYDVILFDLKTNKPIDISDKNIINKLHTRIAGSFLTWILGHEIGHAILHKEYVIESKKGTNLKESGYRDRENQADNYVATALQKGSQQRGKPSSVSAVFWISMGEYFQHKYRQEVEASFKNQISELAWNSEQLPLMIVTNVEVKSKEIPYLLRVINILETLTKNTPHLDETQYYQKTKENIREVDSKFDLILKILMIISIFTLIIMLFLSEKSKDSKTISNYKNEQQNV